MSDQNTFTQPAFARTITGTKRTSRIEARVTDEIKADITRRCHEIGVTESQYVERLLEVSLYGLEHVVSLERDRIARVCGLYEFQPTHDAGGSDGHAA